MYFLNTLKYLSNTHQIRVLRLRAQVQQVCVKYSFKYAYFDFGLKYSKYASNIIVNTRTSTSCTNSPVFACIHLSIWCIFDVYSAHQGRTPITPMFACICLRIWCTFDVYSTHRQVHPYLIVFACVFDAYLTCAKYTHICLYWLRIRCVFDMYSAHRGRAPSTPIFACIWLRIWCVFDAYLTCTCTCTWIRHINTIFACISTHI